MPSGRWLALMAYTGLVFWCLIETFRRAWIRPAFWLCLAGLLFAHGVVYFALLTIAREWRAIWFLPLTIVEFALMASVLDWLGFGEAGLRSREKHNPPSGTLLL
jgi:hypothetical protein